MTHLTAEETSILRATLGLSYWSRECPTRNYIVANGGGGATIAGLVERGYMEARKNVDQGGKYTYYIATDAGRVAVLDQPWKS